ncbi:Subtilase family protein [Ulvibacter litoralis]|uniref:Subtilase family protein n=1 Tax=Ulvibacter litoralis TaxID=227084 RepID=A0A1G7IN75_9FLAO|nr:hypothetical protein GCM10008083_28160 [Ulvibacter litoralis]SDF14028.1 Subtilase family protein [Ulvibacter litoralis]
MSSAQKEAAWFYLRATDTLVLPEFKSENEQLVYIGDDPKLKQVLDRHKVYTFKKTYRKAKPTYLKRTFFVQAEDASLLDDLTSNVSHLFESGDLISEEEKKIYEPNDYGLTSTIGENLGAQVNLDYLDFLGLPEAWYYTTGSRDIIIGISDGGIDTTDVEWKGKSKIFRESRFAKGHGYSVSETAAGQGDNGYAIAGVCFDCSIYATTYDNPRTYEQLLELSEAGVKVINCSWGRTGFYQSSQDAINKMLDNGTVVVAIGHNMSFSQSKGNLFYYPASLDNVIAISSVMHRYEKYNDHILLEAGKNNFYAENIRGYVGRTAGFKDNDTTQTPYIYPQSIRNFNSKIDILGPAVGLYRYGEKPENNNLTDVSEDSPTSGVAPLITGTVGLMFSLAPCLPATEVESILKMTSTNIDDIEVNKPYAGMYGSGMLHTGRAVKMVYQLYSEKETVTIENQRFSRWDFKLTSYSEKVVLKNQTFSDAATLSLNARKQIVLSANTNLKPNSSGNIKLSIDPTLQKECELRLRDPSIVND